MVLDSITIEGFKSIASVQDLKLGPINVLIGPNGSGKSNLIGAFSFLHAIRRGRLQEYVIRAGGANNVLHFGSKSTKLLHLYISLSEQRYQYRLTLIPTDNDGLMPYVETAYYWEEFFCARPYEEPLVGQGGEAGISLPNIHRYAMSVRQSLNSWRTYQFHDTSSSSPIRKTVDVNDNRFLRANASNLAAFLYLLSVKHQTEYNLIRRTVQLVAPFLDDFVLQPLSLNEFKIRLEWRHKGTDAYFDASAFSDGTLRFIALTTLLLQPESLRPSVIIIDEPELGLHPNAITLFASLVKQVSANTQIILSTQSPILLDHFQPDDVIVAERAAGQSHFRQLNAERLKVWLRDYSLGQLWEKNELGGRPRAEDIRGAHE